MTHEQKIDILWDDNPVDISEEANSSGALPISCVAPNGAKRAKKQINA